MGAETANIEAQSAKIKQPKVLKLSELRNLIEDNENITISEKMTKIYDYIKKYSSGVSIKESTMKNFLNENNLNKNETAKLVEGVEFKITDGNAIKQTIQIVAKKDKNNKIIIGIIKSLKNKNKTKIFSSYGVSENKNSLKLEARGIKGDSKISIDIQEGDTQQINETLLPIIDRLQNYEEFKNQEIEKARKYSQKQLNKNSILEKTAININGIQEEIQFA